MMSASSSSATVAVEKATSDLLIGPDWTMNIDICDSVNSHHWQAKDVVKAVKRRLQHKNPKVQLLALTLLETMVKNCGDYVHFQIAEKNMLGEMVKIVRKKADMHVRDKILVLLDSWQEAFGGPGGKHPQYYYAYEELRRSGVIFPQRSQDAALIFTPPATLMVRHPGYGMPSNSARRLDETMATEFESLSLSSLDSMRDVVELLSDMLQAVNPGDKAAVKDEIIVDLVNRCRSFQKKLMQMLTTTGDEELLARGLELNDSLQSLLAKHDAIASGSSLPSQAANLVTKPTTNEVSTSNKRIEVKDSSPGSNVNALAPVASVTRGRYDEDEEEEDDFAQLARRHSKAQPTPGQSTAAGTSETTAMMNNTTATSYDPAASSPVTCTALALLNPPAPERTTKEQDMIDLLSLALSTTSTSPHTHTRFTSDHTMNQVPISPSTQGQPYASQKYPGNQGQVPYNTYVVPWAQPQAQTQTQSQSQSQPHQQYQSQLQPQFQSQTQFQSQFRIQPQPQFQSQSQNTSQFLAQPHTPVQYQSQSQSQIQSQFRNPPQLQAQSQNHFQPESQSQAQIQAQSQNHPQPESQSQAQIQAQSHSQLRPLSQPQYSQYSFGYPPPPWATTPGYLNSQNSLFPTPQSSMTVTNTSMQAARPSQLYSSYTSRASNGSTTIGDPRVNPGPRNPSPAGGQKPFIPSYRLFEDLNVLGSADGRLKVASGTSPSLSGTASQGMVGSRK